ncbi:MAG TPA: multidrug effflux MFS transporter [Chlamydiales bacterium]|nr:multidrug effflux MFS transporter [Chlamydiales bacterium]
MNSKQSKFLLFFLVVLAACLTHFASDIYAPAIPAISIALQTPIDMVQWSMAIYLFGVTPSLLIYGPLSEGYGRKLPLMIGLGIMLIGSVLCSFATSIDMLLWGRLIQGLGAGAAAGLWRSIFRDVFSGEELAQYVSYLVIFITFIVPAAPALGGLLQTYIGWRSNFLFMCFYTLITFFLIAAGLKETNVHRHKERMRFSFIKATYLTLFKSPIFMGITVCTFLSYGAFFSWFVTGPVLLIEKAGISSIDFGLITFLGGGFAYALSGWLNGKYVKKFGIPNMLRFGWAWMTFAGLLMLLGYFFFGINVWAIAVPVIIFYFGSTFIWPNAFAAAFTPFGKIAGYAGGLYSFMQLGGGAVLGSLMSYLPSKNQVPLALVKIICSALSWIIYERVSKD